MEILLMKLNGILIHHYSLIFLERMDQIYLFFELCLWILVYVLLFLVMFCLIIMELIQTPFLEELTLKIYLLFFVHQFHIFV